MNEISGYIEYSDTMRSYTKRQYGLLGWCLIAIFSLMFTVVCLLAVPPVGIIFLGVWLLFFCKVVVKKWKKCASIWKQIKQYRMSVGISQLLTQSTTYCFVSPFSTSNTMDNIISVLKTIGVVSSVNHQNGSINAKIRISSKKQYPVTFYIGNGVDACNVRALFKRRANDDWWDLFLGELIRQSPDVEFGVTLANARVQIAGVLDLQGDIEQQSYSITRHHASLSKFLIGGALFGGAGAVVGGLSGKSKTTTKSHSVYSNQLIVRIIYNNGRLWEGHVSKSEPLYQQILVNLK